MRRDHVDALSETDRDRAAAARCLQEYRQTKKFA
jgi:hypothetical protein